MRLGALLRPATSSTLGGMKVTPDAVLYGFALYLAFSMAWGGCQSGWGSTALSQDAAPEDAVARLEVAVDEELALAIAMVAFNEAPNYPADLALIAQVTLGRGETNEERLAWLRRHSDCVLSDRPMRAHEIAAGNCRWTRHLDELGDPGTPPTGWPSHWRWQGRWEATWLHTLEHARRFVAGERPRGGWPCREAQPITWGSDDDALTAAERGLRPIVCVDHRTGEPTRNTGFVRARR